jgi:hypothetical protein
VVAGIAAHRQVTAQARRVDRVQRGTSGEFHGRGPGADLIQGQQRAGQISVETVPFDQLERGQATGMAIMVSAKTLGNHHAVPGHAVGAARGNAVQ